MRIRDVLASAAMAGISIAVPGCSSSSGSGPADLPGGTSGKSVLRAHHLLDANGRVAPGATAPQGVNELVIWSKRAPETAGPKHQVTIVLPDRFYGASAYAPSYQGTAIAASDVEHWLREAAGRVAHGSV